MKFTVTREAILRPLQAVIGVVERRQTMPILSHVLLALDGNRLSVTATDLEVELRAETDVEGKTNGDVTVPGRKFFDIVRALPSGCNLDFSVSSSRATVKAGKSRFTLAVLSANDFPTIEDIAADHSMTVDQGDLSWLIDKTQFSMAQQDVRYYLNGLLLETSGKTMRAVATDGHRLALAEIDLGSDAEKEEQVIVPRKGVLELGRLLDDEGTLTVMLGTNHVRVESEGTRLTSKLIDGRFPDYGRVIPSKTDGIVKAERATLREALQRTAILANEKYRGVRLELSKDSMVISANNPEQEEATETVAVEYDGAEIEIGFNVNYLLDALSAVDGETIELHVTDGNSSCLVRGSEAERTKYVVMPMRL